MLADLVRAFCRENNYEVYENYAKDVTPVIDGEKIGDEIIVTTIGIVLKQDCSYMDLLEQLSGYIEAKKFDEQCMGQITEELDGTDIDGFGPDSIVYFPAIQDYQPLQPQG